jgi:hypothetical protein
LKIHILTSQRQWARGFNDFFPLFKWEKALNQAGFKFHFFYTKDHPKLFQCDQLWVEYRYFSSFFDTTDKNKDINPVIDFLVQAKAKIGSVVLFDTSDGTGSQCLILTQYVDLHLKKQLYKDLNQYTIDCGDKGFMCWIPDDATPSNIKYYTTTKEHLHKFKLSWNIGMVDYRYFPLSKYYPFGTSKLFPSKFDYIKTAKPHSKKDLITSYRGSISKDTRYSFQRATLIEFFKKFGSNQRIKAGKFIKKEAYLKEMSLSQISFSPFGWGEVCYRDFEIFLSGSVLVKPSMEHLDTFPNYYLPNESYVPMSWDMSDLDRVFNDLMITSKSDLQTLAQRGQRLFLESQNSADNFVNHFKAVLVI